MEKLAVVELDRWICAYTQMDSIIKIIEESVDWIINIEWINRGIVVEVHRDEVDELKSNDYIKNQPLLREFLNLGSYTSFEYLWEDNSWMQLNFIIANQSYLVENVRKTDEWVLEFYSTFEDLDFLWDKLEQWLLEWMDK